MMCVCVWYICVYCVCVWYVFVCVCGRFVCIVYVSVLLSERLTLGGNFITCWSPSWEPVGRILSGPKRFEWV